MNKLLKLTMVAALLATSSMAANGDHDRYNHDKPSMCGKLMGPCFAKKAVASVVIGAAVMSVVNPGFLNKIMDNLFCKPPMPPVPQTPMIFMLRFPNMSPVPGPIPPCNHDHNADCSGQDQAPTTGNDGGES